MLDGARREESVIGAAPLEPHKHSYENRTAGKQDGDPCVDPPVFRSPN